MALVRYTPCHLPYLELTHLVQARPCGVARLPLFGQSGRLKKGRQKLSVDIHSNEFSVNEELFRHYSTLIDHVPRNWERADKEREPTLEIDRIEKVIPNMVRAMDSMY